MQKSSLIIGVDLDNTVICYDSAFYTGAVEKGIIPPNIEPVKESVRNYLRKIGKEELWTELQGYVYGPGISAATAFQGVKEFFNYCKRNNIKAIIISHKTKVPFLGPKHDLHSYVLEWLEKNGFLDHETGLTKRDIFLEITKEEKAKRIVREKCTHFIDDLPEFFSESYFPNCVKKILFDPNKKHSRKKDIAILPSWDEVDKIIK